MLGQLTFIAIFAASLFADPYVDLVENFRAEHHVDVGVGRVDSRWSFGRFGDILGESIEDQAVLLRAQYTYFIPLAKHLGYKIGTGIAYSEPVRTGKVHWANIVSAPGVRTGLCLQFTTLWRINLDLSYHFERINGLGTDQQQELSTALRNFGVRASVDYFFTLRAGVSVERIWQRVIYAPPRGAEGIHDAHFSRRDDGYMLTLLYHLL